MQPPDSDTANFGFSGRPLILIGASVRAAAQSAARAGFRVTGIDLFGDVDTRAACENYVSLDKSAVSVVTRLHPDEATPLMIVGGLDQYVETADQLAAQYPRLGLKADARESLCSPRFLGQIAEQAGILFPLTGCHARGPTESSDRWLCKDPRSSGGLAIKWVSQSWTPAAENGRSYVQRWVPGRPHGATFISNGSACRLLGICEGRFTRISKNPYVYAGSLGPKFPSRRKNDLITKLGQTIVGRTGIAGLFNADFVINGDNVWLLEVNARWTASCELIERWLIDTKQMGQHESLIGTAYRALTSEAEITPNASSPAPPFQYLKRIIFSRRDGRFDIRGIETESTRQVAYADIPVQGQRIRRHDPILTVIMNWAAGASLPCHQTRRVFAQVQQAVL